jgi:signal transduction histidine kinase
MEETSMVLKVQNDPNGENKALTIMAHDLKAPLSSIIDLLDVINKGYVDDPDKIKELVARAGQKAEGLITMLDDIMDYTLLTNKAMIKRDRVDIFDVLTESVGTMKPYAEQRKITVHHQELDSKKYIDGNYSFLLRVFNNLLMNAVKYNKNNGRIDIRWEHDRHADTITVKVSDTGIGIAEEDLEKVFKVFERGKNARRNIDGSLGLGLSLVKQIIEDHYGVIDITSTLGVGTTLIVTLPLMKEKEGGTNDL